jgi:hypothetical protein
VTILLSTHLEDIAAIGLPGVENHSAGRCVQRRGMRLALRAEPATAQPPNFRARLHGVWGLPIRCSSSEPGRLPWRVEPHSAPVSGGDQTLVEPEESVVPNGGPIDPSTGGDPQWLSTDSFVVRLGGAAASVAARAVSALGQVEPLAESGLVLLRVSSNVSDVRTAWKGVLQDFPDADWAAPVLISANGAEHYPNGGVVVRFAAPQGQKDLHAFAKNQGLVLHKRNEFVPTQVSFRPEHPRMVFLPDCVQAIAHLPEVASAWLETMSRYTRQ